MRFRCRRLSELERESEDLRRKLRASQPTDPHPSPIDLLTAAAGMGVRTGSASGPASGVSQSPHIPPPSYPPQLLAPNSGGDRPSAPALESGGLTKSRSLNGVQVQGEEIDDLFQMYAQYPRS